MPDARRRRPRAGARRGGSASRAVVHGAARVGMERRVGDRPGSRGGAASGSRVVEQLARPVVGAVVGVASSSSVNDWPTRFAAPRRQVDVLASRRSGRGRRAPPRPAVPVSPLLPCELEVSRHRRQYSRTTATATEARQGSVTELVPRSCEGERCVCVQAFQAAGAGRAADPARARAAARAAPPARRRGSPRARSSSSAARDHRSTPPAASSREIAATSCGHVTQNCVGNGCPSSSNGACSVTAGRPNGQRTATPRNARGGRPSWRATISSSVNDSGVATRRHRARGTAARGAHEPEHTSLADQFRAGVRARDLLLERAFSLASACTCACRAWSACFVRRYVWSGRQ